MGRSHDADDVDDVDVDDDGVGAAAAFDACCDHSGVPVCASGDLSATKAARPGIDWAIGPTTLRSVCQERAAHLTRDGNL